jgi:hypothetical protein
VKAQIGIDVDLMRGVAALVERVVPNTGTHMQTKSLRYYLQQWTMRACLNTCSRAALHCVSRAVCSASAVVLHLLTLTVGACAALYARVCVCRVAEPARERGGVCNAHEQAGEKIQSKSLMLHAHN